MIHLQRKTWIYLILSTATVLALLVWAFAPRPTEVELAPVVLGRFETTVDEDAKTRLADRFVVSAPLAGRLARITLREGDAVQPGAQLAVLKPTLPAMLDERTRRELLARVQGAQDGVARADTRVARARVNLEQAQNEARRSEQLAREGFVAPTKLETDRLAARAAQREVEAASAEQRMAGHELEQARASLGASRQSPGDTGAAGGYAVRAPVGGKVLRVLQTSEATVAMGTPLVELGDTQRLEVVAELLTTDAMAARPGSRVTIERWGGPVTLEGRVRSVEPAAFTKVSALGVEEQRVRVLIDIVSPRELWQALGDGFRVGVRIVTLAQNDAVQAPLSAVFPLPSEGAPANAPADANGGAADRAGHAVFVQDGDHARKVPVVLGGRNTSVAWVRSGLSAGQSVVVYPPTALTDGMAIRVRKP